MVIKFNNKVVTYNSKWVSKSELNPNPLNLPPYTIRVKYASGTRPTGGSIQTLVDAEENIWDVYYPNTNWSNLFKVTSSEDIYNLLEVLGANTANVYNMSNMFSGNYSLTSVAYFDTSAVTDMSSMFYYTGLTSVPLFDTSSVTNMSSMLRSCSSLTSVSLFDTSNVTDMSYMFSYCYGLTSVPLFDTSNVTNMNNMFYMQSSSLVPYTSQLTTVPLFDTSKVTITAGMFMNCYNVESGALALYQQMSSQANPPEYKANTFRNCGSNTVTGAAELAQIPSGWK